MKNGPNIPERWAEDRATKIAEMLLGTYEFFDSNKIGTTKRHYGYTFVAYESVRCPEKKSCKYVYSVRIKIDKNTGELTAEYNPDLCGIRRPAGDYSVSKAVLDAILDAMKKPIADELCPEDFI